MLDSDDDIMKLELNTVLWRDIRYRESRATNNLVKGRRLPRTAAAHDSMDSRVSDKDIWVTCRVEFATSDNHGAG